MTGGGAHRPSIDGMIYIDDAIADVMRSTGMTRRNAARFLRKGIKDGRIKTRVIDKITLNDRALSADQVADLMEDD